MCRHYSKLFSYCKLLLLLQVYKSHTLSISVLQMRPLMLREFKQLGWALFGFIYTGFNPVVYYCMSLLDFTV